MAIAASARVRRARNESSESESAALRTESGGGLCAKTGREAARQSARKRAGRSLTRGGRAEALEERDRATRYPDPKVHHAAPFRPVARPPPTREADRVARLRRGLHQQTPWATPQCLAVRRARPADLRRPLPAATPDVGRTVAQRRRIEAQCGRPTGTREPPPGHHPVASAMRQSA